MVDLMFDGLGVQLFGGYRHFGAVFIEPPRLHGYRALDQAFVTGERKTAFDGLAFSLGRSYFRVNEDLRRFFT